jgi:hypothetical protein
MGICNGRRRWGLGRRGAASRVTLRVLRVLRVLRANNPQDCGAAQRAQTRSVIYWWSLCICVSSTAARMYLMRGAHALRGTTHAYILNEGEWESMVRGCSAAPS